MKQKLFCLLTVATLSGLGSLPAATNVVRIGNYFFSPTNLTINVGDTVLWTNTTATANPAVRHDTTRTNANFSWSSGLLNSNTPTFSLTFSNAGTFDYVCATHVYAFNQQQRHPEQTGTVFVVSASLPPSVSLTNPVNNAKFRAPANLLLEASATDDGTVTNVQFFSGPTLLGSDNSSPYSFTLTDAPAANYSLTARAQDNSGLSATSTVVNVSVLTNAVLTAPTRLPDGQFALAVLGIAGQTYATEVSSNLTSWSAILTNVAPANTFNVTDSTSPGVLLRFYRARQDF